MNKKSIKRDILVKKDKIFKKVSIFAIYVFLIHINYRDQKKVYFFFLRMIGLFLGILVSN